MNPNARYATVEVLLNDDELSLLDQIRGGLGRSPFLRHLMHGAAGSHGKPPSPVKEPRACRGIGKAASRGSGFMMQRRQV